MSIDIRAGRLEGVVASSSVTQVGTGFGFLEGPVWDGAAGQLVFSDIPGDRMLRYLPGVGVSTYREPSNMANGSAYDREGRLITCEHATSRVVREEHDGSLTVIAAAFDGAELNSPNDVIVRADGAIVFTDPIFGRNPFFGVERPPSQDCRGVYRIDPLDGQVRRLAGDFDQPNGVCESADGRYLFVNDTARAHIRRFAWEQDGLEGGEVWAEVSGDAPGAPDGMKLDSAGNLFCTGPGGLHVFDGDGGLLGVIGVPESPANFNWGGADLRTLFICACTSLYSLELHVPGRGNAKAATPDGPSAE